jgi:lipoyl(octanoyl) transferase
MHMKTELILTEDWGVTSYEEAWRRQEAQLDEIIQGTRPQTLVFTEHKAVFTIGMRSGSEKHLIWTEEMLRQQGVEVVKTNRGGDITYHGPGQIVGYPLVNLEPRRDLHAYLRFLEEILIKTVEQVGLSAARNPGKTGIWIGKRKIAAIGVAVRRWHTYHGFALNVQTNLQHFTGIVPCGISPEEGQVTSLSEELGKPIPLATVKPILEQEFKTLLPSYWDGSFQ